MPEPIPITLLTGCPGAEDTIFLNHLLHEPDAWHRGPNMVGVLRNASEVGA